MYSNRRKQQYGGGYPKRRNSKKGSLSIMVIIGLCYAGYSLFQYYTTQQVNPITGESQHVAITPEQEVAIGLQSKPYMMQQHGGLHPDQRAQAHVDAVGARLVNNSIARRSSYQYDFHLLADPQTINAFALPGGQVFITAALYSQLENEDQLAGILGHEIGHVIHRHGAQRLASEQLGKKLTGAAVVLSGDYSLAQSVQMVSNMVNMKYGRDQELESDDFGVRLMVEAGYRPEDLIGVMDILEKASGGSSKPEFQSTHPSPDNRREMIRAAIEKYQG